MFDEDVTDLVFVLAAASVCVGVRWTATNGQLTCGEHENGRVVLVH